MVEDGIASTQSRIRDELQHQRKANIPCTGSTSKSTLTYCTQPPIQFAPIKCFNNTKQEVRFLEIRVRVWLLGEHAKENAAFYYEASVSVYWRRLGSLLGETEIDTTQGCTYQPMPKTTRFESVYNNGIPKHTNKKLNHQPSTMTAGINQCGLQRVNNKVFARRQSDRGSWMFPSRKTQPNE